MPIRSKIQQLPPDIRGELLSRLKESGFSGYKSHSKWLAEKGYSIGYSAIQSYVSANRDRLDVLFGANDADDSVGGFEDAPAGPEPHPTEVRLRCLTIAAQLAGGGLTSLDSVTAIAQDLVEWVVVGDPERLY